jgi:glutamate racemase
MVERVAGGQDTLDNLVLMCVHCNRTQKPIHRTLADARAWIDSKQQPVADTWRPFMVAMYGLD